MRFYLDENLPPQVAVLARARGVDAVSNHERGHLGLSDDELEAFAAQAHEKLKTRREAKKLEAAREAKRLLDSVGLTFRDAERLAGRQQPHQRD